MENRAPYDLAGTASGGAAQPFYLNSLPPGEHVLYVRVIRQDGSLESLSARVTLGGDSPPNSIYSLKVSQLPDRSAPQGLAGSLVFKEAFVFLEPSTDETPVEGSSVEFYLDSLSGSPHRLERRSPFDFAGTAADGSAIGWNPGTVEPGEHIIFARVLTSSGLTTLVQASFQSISPPPDGAALVVSPRILSLNLGSGESEQIGLFVGVNEEADGSIVPFTVDTSDDWVSVDPQQGNASQLLEVRVDSSGLPEGEHSGFIDIKSAVVGSVQVPVNLKVGSSCGVVSCDKIKVQLPYELSFDSDAEGLTDVNGVGTGFTYLDRSSKGLGYIASNLVVDAQASRLRLQSTAGLQFQGVNSLDNALGVGFAGANQITEVTATLLNPAQELVTGNYEQAGLWFGTDEDNYVKLDYISKPAGPEVEMLVEISGIQAFRVGINASGAAGTDLRLKLVGNPRTLEVSGYYVFGSGEYSALGSFNVPPEFFSFDAAGIDPIIGTRSFAGIYGSHRNADSAVEWDFGEFAVRAGIVETQSSEFAFDRISYPVDFPTSMVWGPDNRLYVTELFGTIHALSFNADLELVEDEVITSLVDQRGVGLTLGIAIDPASTADEVALWVTHSQDAVLYSVGSGLLNSGAVHRLSGPAFAVVEDMIVGLPRAIANHAPNSLHFGPDNRLYLAVGGNTGAGAPVAVPTEFGNRPEQPLSAAILVADVFAEGFNGACYAAGQDPLFGSPGCDVFPYATGLRNSYDFVWHTNGQMYATDNGLGVTGAYPPVATPACFGLASHLPVDEGGQNPGQQPDLLLRVSEGAYYGHPNPSRDECVFKDGSLQGVSPLSNYVPELAVLGDHTSSNGIIEYRGSAGCGHLRGNLMITNYSRGDNVLRVVLSEDGSEVVLQDEFLRGFVDPLTLVEGPEGDIFVAEFGAGKITALRAADTSCWEILSSPLPQAVLDAAGIVLDGLFYVISGKTESGYISNVYAYDPQANNWSTVADKPGLPVENAAAVAVSGQIFVFGGSTAPFSGAVAESWRYEPSANEWSSIAPMPTPRGGARAEVVDGLVYVIGGMGSDGASVATVEVYDPVANSWRSGTSLLQERDNPGSAVVGGKIYVFGGRHRSASGAVVQENLFLAEVYDPATGAWTGVSPMNVGRRTMVVGVIDGMILVAGGEADPSSVDGVFHVVERYDPNLDTWTRLSDVENARHGAAFGTIDGRIYVAGGGLSKGSAFTDLLEVY